MIQRPAVPACFFVLLLIPGCAASPSPAPPPSEPPATVTPPPTDEPSGDVPPSEGATRPAISAEQCEARGGAVVGDIGDGATQRADYVCPGGGAPTANIAAPPGGPVAVEGAVCCPKSGTSTSPAPPLGPGGASWITQDSGVKVADAWRSCAADTDCALVETACCDHCNGGKAVAVNKSHVQDAGNLRPKCGPTACTKRACMTRAACEKGMCVMQVPGAP